MGLFDSLNGLTNLTPEQNQGLLAAAAQILQQSGPSRTPTSLGQILGGGIGAFQQSAEASRKRKLEEDQAAQIAQIRAQQLQTGQLDIEGRQREAQQQALLQQAYGESGGDPQKLVDAVSRVDPIKGFQLRQQLAKSTEFDTKPQVAVGPDGKPFTYIIGKDGTVKRLDNTLPRDELKLADLGGRSVAYNPFALQPGQSFQRTATPDALVSASTAIRGQDLTNARGIESNLIARERLNSEKAPTEFQGKSAAFGLRAREADKILTDLTGKFNPAAVNAKTSVADWPLIGGALGAATNYALNENDQKAEQAQRDFINAVLRQESGAAIGSSEFDNARKQYFPQPGDSAAVIQQKARNRQLAIQGFDNNAGKAKMTPNPFMPTSSGWGITKVSD